jgi:hypothetical protein
MFATITLLHVQLILNTSSSLVAVVVVKAVLVLAVIALVIQH